MNVSRDLQALFALTFLAVVGLCASAITAAKFVALGPFVFPCSNVIFSLLTFPVTDIVSEVWGKQRAKTVVWVSFGGQALFVLLIHASIYLPAAEVWEGQEAYTQVLGVGPRILVASMVAFLTSQMWDVIAYSYLKQRTKGRWLWLRNNLSTFSSQVLNSTLFIVIAFYGSGPVGQLITGSVVLKWLIAVIDTPLVYGGVRLVTWFTGDTGYAYTESEEASVVDQVTGG